LAGKFEKICTAFPLTTFNEKHLERLAFKSFERKKVLKDNSGQKIPSKTAAPPGIEKAIFIFQDGVVFFLLEIIFG